MHLCPVTDSTERAPSGMSAYWHYHLHQPKPGVLLRPEVTTYLQSITGVDSVGRVRYMRFTFVRSLGLLEEAAEKLKKLNSYDEDGKLKTDLTADAAL